MLFDNLWHTKWLSGHSNVVPMFLCLNTTLGVCLLLAVKQPARHRLKIALGPGQALPMPLHDHLDGAGRGAGDAQSG